MVKMVNQIFDKEEIREEVAYLLPLVYARTFGASMRSKPRFDLDNLKHPIPTKSVIYRLDRVGAEYVGNVPEIQPVIAVKKYREAVERSSEDNVRSCRDELDREDSVLFYSNELRLSMGEKTYIIYPESYSATVTECYDRGYIFREFIHGDTLEKVALKELRGKKEVEWSELSEAVKNPLYPIALLHVKGNDLKRRLREGYIQRPTAEELVEDCVHYLWKISEKKVSRDRIKEAVAESLLTLTETYFTENHFNTVINGDLDVYTQHIIISPEPSLSSRLLDAGSTQEGAFTRDLAVYTDPVFTQVKNVERGVSEEYNRIIDMFKEHLRFPISKFNLDEVSLGVCAAGCKGNIRRAASLINYKKAHYEGEGKLESFMKEVGSHLERSLYFGEKLIEEGGKVGGAAKKLLETIDSLCLFKDYADYFNGKGNHQQRENNKNDGKGSVKFAGLVEEVEVIKTQ